MVDDVSGCGLTGRVFHHPLSFTLVYKNVNWISGWVVWWFPDDLIMPNTVYGYSINRKGMKAFKLWELEVNEFPSRMRRK